MSSEITQVDLSILHQTDSSFVTQSDVTVADLGSGDGPHRYWRLLSIRGIPAANGYLEINEMELRETSGGPNVATGGTASASSLFGSNVASNAFNGNPSDYWESDDVIETGDTPSSRGTWLKYDLGAGNAKLIQEVSILVNAYVDEGPLDFLIQYSDDDVTWTSKGRFRAATPWVVSTPQVFSLSRPVVTGRRYWRLYSIAAQNGADYTTIQEISLNEYAGGPDRAFPSYQSCDGFFSGYQSWKAIDRNAATAWGSPSLPHPHWWQVDHSEGYGFQCDTYSLTCHTNISEMVKDWELQFSDDGANWTTAHAVTGEPAWTAGETRTYTTTDNGSSGGPPTPAPTGRRRPVIVACGD